MSLLCYFVDGAVASGFGNSGTEGNADRVPYSAGCGTLYNLRSYVAPEKAAKSSEESQESVFPDWGWYCDGSPLILSERNRIRCFFTILAFIVYAIIVFISRATETSHKAYTDSHTGLANRLRWNELMKEDSPIPEPFGILLMDLNGLKQVNDSLGHDMGDRVIFHFSNILRNTLPASSIICRWGGDEFAILLTGISRRQLDGYIQALLHATETHNAENHTLPIHFAAGSALSAEHPSMTRTELFHLADEEMYRDKQLWYAKKHLTKNNRCMELVFNIVSHDGKRDSEASEGME